MRSSPSLANCSRWKQACVIIVMHACCLLSAVSGCNKPVAQPAKDTAGNAADSAAGDTARDAAGNPSNAESISASSAAHQTATDPPNRAVDAASNATSAKKTERTLEQQLADVLDGSSDTIRLEHTAVARPQLQLFVGPTKLAQLKTLILDEGVVTDNDVSLLTNLSGLQHLRLRHSPLSDVGLSDLARARLDDLLILNLPQARPGVAGLKALGQLPRLRQLRIGGKLVDDAGIEELARWPALESLHLIRPSITDKSLETIARMENLSSFYIDQCPLSDAAWEKLFQARPKLHVHIDQVHHDLDPT